MKAIRSLLKMSAVSLLTLSSPKLYADAEIDLLFKRMDSIPGFGTLVWHQYVFMGQSMKDGSLVFDAAAIPEGESLSSPNRRHALIKRSADGNYEIISETGQATNFYDGILDGMTESFAGPSCAYSGLNFQATNAGNILYRPQFSGSGLQATTCGSNPQIGDDLGIVMLRPDGSKQLIQRSGESHPDFASLRVGAPTLQTPDINHYSSASAYTLTSSHLSQTANDGSGILRYSTNSSSNPGSLFAFVGDSGESYPLARVGRVFNELPGFRIQSLSDNATGVVGLRSSLNARYIVQKVTMRSLTGTTQADGLILWNASSPTNLKLIQLTGYRFNVSLNRWESLNAGWQASPSNFLVTNQGIVYELSNGNNGSILTSHRLLSGKPRSSLVLSSGQNYDSAGQAKIGQILNMTADATGRIYLSFITGIPANDGTGGFSRVMPALRAMNADASIQDLYNPLVTNLQGSNPKFQEGMNVNLTVKANDTGGAMVCGPHGPVGGSYGPDRSCHLFVNGSSHLISESGMEAPNDASRVLRLDEASLVGMNDQHTLAFIAQSSRPDGSDPKAEVLWMGSDRELRQMSLAPQRLASGEIAQVLVGLGGQSELGGRYALTQAGIGAEPNLILQAKIYEPTANIGELSNEAWTMGVVRVDLASDQAPTICAADYNRSGYKSTQDLFDYIAAYSQRDLNADMNGDNQVSVQDFFDFIRIYQTTNC